MLVEVGKFAAGAATRQLSRWEFQLLEPLVLNDAQFGELVVPAGFTSDLASVRILREVCRWTGLAALFASIALTFWSWLAPLLCLVSVGSLALYGLVVGYGMRAAILHDWLYSQSQLTRRQCDAVFYRALTRGDGTADWRALIFWLGVRMGGAALYGRA